MENSSEVLSKNQALKTIEDFRKDINETTDTIFQIMGRIPELQMDVAKRNKEIEELEAQLKAEQSKFFTKDKQRIEELELQIERQRNTNELYTQLIADLSKSQEAMSDKLKAAGESLRELYKPIAQPELQDQETQFKSLSAREQIATTAADNAYSNKLNTIQNDFDKELEKIQQDFKKSLSDPGITPESLKNAKDHADSALDDLNTKTQQAYVRAKDEHDHELAAIPKAAQLEMLIELFEHRLNAEKPENKPQNKSPVIESPVVSDEEYLEFKARIYAEREARFAELNNSLSANTSTPNNVPESTNSTNSKQDNKENVDVSLKNNDNREYHTPITNLPLYNATNTIIKKIESEEEPSKTIRPGN